MGLAGKNYPCLRERPWRCSVRFLLPSPGWSIGIRQGCSSVRPGGPAPAAAPDRLNVDRSRPRSGASLAYAPASEPPAPGRARWRQWPWGARWRRPVPRGAGVRGVTGGPPVEGRCQSRSRGQPRRAARLGVPVSESQPGRCRLTGAISVVVVIRPLPAAVWPGRGSRG